MTVEQPSLRVLLLWYMKLMIWMVQWHVKQTKNNQPRKECSLWLISLLFLIYEYWPNMVSKYLQQEDRDRAPFYKWNILWKVYLGLRKVAKDQGNHTDEREVGDKLSNQRNRLNHVEKSINHPVTKPLLIILLIGSLQSLERGIYGVNEHDEVTRSKWTTKVIYPMILKPKVRMKTRHRTKIKIRAM